MTTLYLDRRHLQLSLSGQTLRIHRDGKLERTLPLGLVEHIVCQANVDISTSLLANLAHHGIGLTCFGGRHGQHSAHLGITGTRDINRRIGQYRLYLDTERRLGWSIHLIAHKLLQQLRFLYGARRQRPDLRRPLTKSLATMHQLYQQLRKQPPLSIDSLRGIEGSAARLYFQAYASILPPSFGFQGRQRRPPPDPVNALLSLGYTLLHGEMHKVIEGVGLDPWLGLYHQPYHGRASLVCDLVEPWRPRVDALVWALIRSRTLRQDHFGADSPASAAPSQDWNIQSPCLLNKAGRALFYPLYEAHAREWRGPVYRQMLALAQIIGHQATQTAVLMPDDADDIPFGTEQQELDT